MLVLVWSVATTKGHTDLIHWALIMAGPDMDGLVQDCSDSSADALELLQSYTEAFHC